MSTVTYDYHPTPKQTLAHTFTDVDELLFGGSAGGGKAAGGEPRQSATAYSSPESASSSSDAPSPNWNGLL